MPNGLVWLPTINSSQASSLPITKLEQDWGDSAPSDMPTSQNLGRIGVSKPPATEFVHSFASSWCLGYAFDVNHAMGTPQRRVSGPSHENDASHSHPFGGQFNDTLPRLACRPHHPDF
jgi:hypothetical protein